MVFHFQIYSLGTMSDERLAYIHKDIILGAIYVTYDETEIGCKHSLIHLLIQQQQQKSVK